MKTNGATWKAYLASWPDGQYFDHSDETYDGKEPETDEPTDDAVVEFSCGVVYAGGDDREGSDLVRHFSRWKKLQSMVALTCWVPKEKEAELRAAVKDMNGRIA